MSRPVLRRFCTGGHLSEPKPSWDPLAQRWIVQLSTARVTQLRRFPSSQSTVPDLRVDQGYSVGVAVAVHGHLDFRPFPTHRSGVASPSMPSTNSPA